MDRYLSNDAKMQFVVGRAMTRWIFAKRWSIRPIEVSFGQTRYGKPFAVTPTGQPASTFNLSHCSSTVALVLGGGIELGIDVEFIVRNVDINALAEFCLCSSEQQGIDNLFGTERSTAFFRLWTFKEACVKTLGTGLVTDIKSVTCEFDYTNATFCFTYPRSVLKRISAMAAWQFDVPSNDIITLAAADDGMTAFDLRVTRVVAGLEFDLR